MIVKLPKSGAVLNKELEITDFCDGRRYNSRMGWLMTFQPCAYCLRNGDREGGASAFPVCKRTQFTLCEREYREVWEEKFIGNGAQFRLDNYGFDDKPQNKPRNNAQRTITM